MSIKKRPSVSFLAGLGMVAAALMVGGGTILAGAGFLGLLASKNAALTTFMTKLCAGGLFSTFAGFGVGHTAIRIAIPQQKPLAFVAGILVGATGIYAGLNQTTAANTLRKEFTTQAAAAPSSLSNNVRQQNILKPQNLVF